MLERFGFSACAEDSCLFCGGSREASWLILVYFDDRLIAGKTNSVTNNGLRVISEAFKARNCNAPT